MIDRGPRAFTHYRRCDDPNCQWYAMPAFTAQIKGTHHYHYDPAPKDGVK